MERKSGKKVTLLNLLHINIQSLNNKILELELVSHNSDISFICLNEHWLTTNEIDNVIVDNYYLVSKYCRPTRKHGGVCIFARHDIECTPINLDYLNNEINFEIAGLRSKDFYIFTIYRSPLGDFDVFLDSLTQLLDNFFGKTMIISGDFNVKFNTSDSNATIVCNLFASYGLISLNLENVPMLVSIIISLI